MKIEFRVGSVFPADDPVAQFLTGLCIITNDLTLAVENTGVEFAREGGERLGVPTYYLFQTCAQYREAAKYLTKGLKNPRVADFIKALGPEAEAHLIKLLRSCDPWSGSFVESKLKPIRDVVYHYFDPEHDEIESYLRQAENLNSAIDLGTGTYSETRYQFADEVINKHVVATWGEGEEDLASVMTEVARLVVSFTHFTHFAVNKYLDGIDPSLLRPVD